MNTKILSTNKEDIAKAAVILRQGGLVAFPTETVYGLGADALSEEAVGKVYAAKGRPSDNPMIVHIARASDLGRLTPMLSPDIVTLVENFWPPADTGAEEKRRHTGQDRPADWTQWQCACLTAGQRWI